MYGSRRRWKRGVEPQSQRYRFDGYDWVPESDVLNLGAANQWTSVGYEDHSKWTKYGPPTYLDPGFGKIYVQQRWHDEYGRLHLTTYSRPAPTRAPSGAPQASATPSGSESAANRKTTDGSQAGSWFPDWTPDPESMARAHATLEASIGKNNLDSIDALSETYNRFKTQVPSVLADLTGSNLKPIIGNFTDDLAASLNQFSEADLMAGLEAHKVNPGLAWAGAKALKWLSNTMLAKALGYAGGKLIDASGALAKGVAALHLRQLEKIAYPTYELMQDIKSNVRNKSFSFPRLAEAWRSEVDFQWGGSKWSRRIPEHARQTAPKTPRRPPGPPGPSGDYEEPAPPGYYSRNRAYPRSSGGFRFHKPYPIGRRGYRRSAYVFSY